MKPTVILVIRRDDRFSELLRARGFQVENLELIRTEPLEDQSVLRQRLEHLSDYDGLFFTSPAAAEVFINESRGERFNGKIFALGQRARNVLQNGGYEVYHDDAANTSEELIDHIDSAEIADKKLLFVRGDKSMRTVVERLNGSAKIDEVVVYYTKRLRPDDKTLHKLRPRLGLGDIHWVCFFSPSGVENFCRLFDVEEVRAKVAAIGETTAEQIRSSRLPLSLVPTKASSEDFARQLSEYIKEH
jgi:uroporphyrinogen-III synthase